MNDKIKVLQNSIDLLPGIWCLVDRDSRYLHYNQAYLDLVGAANLPKDYLLGKTVSDIPCNAASCADLFWQADDLVRKKKTMVRVLHSIQMVDNQWKIIQIDKQPILDDAGEVIAIIFHCIDHSANHFLDLALSIAKQNENSLASSADKRLVVLDNSQTKVLLKQKESECLFYLIRGFAYKEIAKLQSVSYSTIVDHVERLKLKFNASTSNELISRALAAGYPGSVPQKFFDHQISIILS